MQVISSYVECVMSAVRYNEVHERYASGML